MRVFSDDLYRLWNSVLDVDNNLTEFRKNVVYTVVNYVLDKGVRDGLLTTRNGFANAIYTCLDRECLDSNFSDLFVGLVCGMESLKKRKAAVPVHVEAIHENEDKPYVKFTIEYTGNPFIFDRPPHEKQKVIDGRKTYISNVVLGTNTPNDIESVVVDRIYQNLWEVDTVVGGKCDIPTLVDLWKKYLNSAIEGDVVDTTTLLFLTNMESVDLVTSHAFSELYSFVGPTKYKHQQAGRIVYDLDKVCVVPEEEEVYRYSFIKGKDAE